MITTKELLKSKLENIREEYLDILLRMANSFEALGTRTKKTSQQRRLPEDTWLEFIQETYGCLANDPIKRGDQGSFEVREAMK